MSKVVLTVAGSDSGGGAGIQADLKTFSALGLHGTCAITAVTAQNTKGVQEIFGLPPETVLSQLDSITDDFSIAFAKTGMLHNAGIIEAVAMYFRDKKIPFVLDPVIEAEAGGKLLQSEALETIKKFLLPIAFVVTPNIFEAEALTGIKTYNLARAKQSGRKILDMGARAVIIKGGHLDCTDILCTMEDVHLLEGKRQQGANHGVGCTYSAALTSYLAMGYPLKEAARKAKKFAAKSVLHSFNVGRGVGPVDQIASVRINADRFKVITNLLRAIHPLNDHPI